MSVEEINGKNILGEMFKGSKNALRWVDEVTKSLDKNGILIYKIPYTNRFDYYPTFIARFALGNLEMYLETKEDVYRKNFFRQVNWLLKNLKEKKDYCVWEHYYRVPYYSFNRVPWVHGLAQGLGMTVFLKAYQLTEKDEFLNVAKKIFNSFEIDIEDGGIRYIDEDGNMWLEEYAILPPPHVLNGFITILFSVREFYHMTKNKTAFEIWKKGLKTLKINLRRYDIGYWSIYDLLNRYPAPLKYHIMHVQQLEILYKITGEKIFKNYGLKWKQHVLCKKNKVKAKFNRGKILLQKYGVTGSVVRYIQRKKWERGS